MYSEIDDKIFNVEMQLWSSRDFDPARRTRYYQSVIMFRALISLVQDQLLSLSEAAKRLHMTEDEFRALL